MAQAAYNRINDQLGGCCEWTMLELIRRLIPLVDDEELVVRMVAELINNHQVRLTGSFSNIEKIEI